MTDLNTKKNQIRLQLRKARQRAIKNLRRDMSKYPEDQEKFNKILVRVKKAKIERVLTLLLGAILRL